MSDLQNYSVRESSRARNVNLRILMGGSLEVVIPRGFNRSLIPDILHKKHHWIRKHTNRLEQRRKLIEAGPEFPDRLDLQAIGEIWQVEYRPTSSPRVIAIEKKSGRRLVLNGHTENVELCRATLRKWMARKAREHLEPWLTKISRTEQLPFERVTIRGQKTRWGSCSSRGTISLNYKLLFLPDSLVRYVLIHELCHIKQLNHSAKFWALVNEKDPAYKKSRAELRNAWRFVPGWLQDGKV